MKIGVRVKLLLLLIILIALASGIYAYGIRNNRYIELSYRDFLNHIDEDLVDEVEFNNRAKLKGKLRDGQYFITDNPRTENFKEHLLLYNVNVIEGDNRAIVGQAAGIALILFGIGALAYILNRNSPKQAEKEMAIMSKVDAEGTTSRRITFDDVAGNEEAKDSLKELIDFIGDPEKYNRYGARLPRGVLLYGPPGTGKTLLAKALAGEANVPFYAVSGSDFIQVYAGLGASRIRELFKRAKDSGKSVIFIDEIDALGKKRNASGGSGGSEEADRTLNALLTEMSGFKGNEGIIVMAATNRMDTLDEALLRPGRFDRQIEISLPDVNARLAILELHSKNKPVSRKVDLKNIALETIYFSGAQLENLMNESAMLAARQRADNITMKHINQAYFTVLVGEEKKDRRSITSEDKRITAYHEAGHALVAKKICKDNRVTKVSIIPSTKGMGGFSLNIPPDRMYQTKKDIMNNIMIALGGRAAEELVLGMDNITTGASSDLQKATEMVLSMIGNYGMDDEIGLMNYNVALNSNLDTGTLLMERAKKFLDKLYVETKEVLQCNKEYLDAIAAKLLVEESLSEEELNRILLD
ncbi:MAG: ATP-dependent zinc metalloprotease FtsH [Tissierellia bacterium]|nr:ATP-dependent zinc metalloprotease FtsH [Tissierellia bacterium]